MSNVSNGKDRKRLKARKQPVSDPVSVPAIVLGIKPWKRWQIGPFLLPRYASLRYVGSPEQALRVQRSEAGVIVVWAAREPPDFAARAAAQGARVLRMEDGFLRSAGLGSNHVGGASLVLDPVGIHFDPRAPSSLEQRLQRGDFDAAVLERARRLRERLIGSGVTKYNVGTRGTWTSSAVSGRRRVLVPGQVEDDASVRLGSPAIRGNLDLLRAVREAEPQAWLIYKPHPDIEAGTRSGVVDDARVKVYADEIVRGVSLAAMLPAIDHVHTMTSLVGFEALLRAIPVTTHGLPFYAGWGLTEDRLPLPRRTRRCSLDELTAAALIEYPLYADLVTGRPCEVEDVVTALENRTAVASRSTGRRMLRLMQGWLRSVRATNG